LPFSRGDQKQTTHVLVFNYTREYRRNERVFISGKLRQFKFILSKIKDSFVAFPSRAFKSFVFGAGKTKRRLTDWDQELQMANWTERY
jgi:hypothetical protein